MIERERDRVPRSLSPAPPSRSPKEHESMPRSVARKVAWAGRTTSTAIGPELAGMQRHGAPIRQAGAGGQLDGRDAA
jgi:hypothetical protein